MRNILVTGGAGFIGSNFVHYWCERYPQDRVIVIDALTYAGNLPNINSLIEKDLVEFIEGDICDQQLVLDIFSRFNIGTVVHFAAETHVDRSIDDPSVFIRTNIQGTYTLLEVALKAWEDSLVGNRFHHVSTDEVYGQLGPSDPPFLENNSYEPRSPYSASKASSDMLVRAYHATYNLPISISNCSNNYGPYQYPEKLIPLMLINVLEGEKLPVYGDGSNVRDWLYVKDHCRAIDLILEKGREGETYNIGGDMEIDNLSLVKKLCRLVDKKLRNNKLLLKRFTNSAVACGKESESLITFVDDRAGHDWRYAINMEKIRRELGFSLQVNFLDGLDRTVQWYIDNEKWWCDLHGEN